MVSFHPWLTSSREPALLHRLLARLWSRPFARRGEDAAAAHLRRQGYRILGRNLRSRIGEVDLLAEAPDGRTIVVVEVKAGHGGPLPPEIRVGPVKQRRLTALAAHLARRHRLTQRPIRFDVIGVDLPAEGPPRIRHHINAFAAHV